MDRREDLFHVKRGSTFPWRDPDDLETECGRLVIDVPSVSRDEMRRKIAHLGIQRASLSSCMTCLHTAQRHRDWEKDPVDTMRREVTGRRHDQQLRTELLAIAALIDNHRDEFQAYLDGLSEAVDLTRRRQESKVRKARQPRR